MLEKVLMKGMKVNNKFVFQIIVLFISFNSLYAQYSDDFEKDSVIRYKEIINNDWTRRKIPMYQYLVAKNGTFRWNKMTSYGSDYYEGNKFTLAETNDTIWISFISNKNKEKKVFPRYSINKKDTLYYISETSINLDALTYDGIIYYQADTILRIKRTSYYCRYFIKDKFDNLGRLTLREKIFIDKKRLNPVQIEYEYYIKNKKTKDYRIIQIDGLGKKRNPRWAEFKIFHRRPKRKKP
jgi:phenolic acid decarboxylase